MATTINPSTEATTCCSCQLPYPLSLLTKALCCKGRLSHRNPAERQNGTEEILKRVVAVYDYSAIGNGDISMKKGDVLLIVNSVDPDWWRATNAVTQKTGFIPRSNVAEETAIDSEDWFFDISRKEAEKLLEQSDIERGTFIVRNSEQGTYALSMRGPDPEFKFGIKHYKIRLCDDGRYYISPKHTFPNLQSLVAYYLENDGLCHRLVKACPKPKPHRWDLSHHTKDHWEVDRSMIKITGKLGQGSFGVVWHALWNDHVEIAVKEMKPGSMSKDQFLLEATIMKGLRHEKLVSLYAVCSDREPIYIVTEYMPLGSLLDYLRSDAGRQLEFRILLHMAAQIAYGMMYLEERELVHRDLAARNVLVGHNDIVKIGDFGLARILEDKIYSAENSKVPVKWTAPEALLTYQFTVKSDVWSFGVLLMEIITRGEIPYPAMTNTEAHEFVLSGKRMVKPKHHFCNNLLYDMMLQCWDKHPQKRPTFEFLFHSLDDYLVGTDKSYVPTDEVEFAEEEK